MTQATSNIALSLIADNLNDFNANILEFNDNQLLIEMAVYLTDGRTAKYRLIITAENKKPKAKEDSKSPILPSFCPERHINHDGTFCLYWDDEKSLEIINDITAADWLSTLNKFLRLQERAENLKSWPSEATWAHGGAAIYQREAQTAAEHLGIDFLNDLNNGKIIASEFPKKSNKEQRTIRVYRSDIHILTIWKNLKKATRLKKRCVCGADLGKKKKKKSLKKCSNHEKNSVILGLALVEWKKQENIYWESMKENPCCGRIVGCPLKKINSI